MSRFIRILILTHILVAQLNAQELNEYNQFNENGKKQGYWEHFLNDKFIECTEKDAVYQYYVYYQDGDKIMGKIPKWIDNCELNKKGEGIKEGALTLLNGTYEFRRKDKEGWTYKIKFNKGFPEYDRIDRDTTGKNYSEIFYTTKFNSMEASYYTVSESNGAYFKGYYYLDRGKMRDNIEKIKIKKSSEKRFK